MTVIVTILGLGRFDKNTGVHVYEEATYQWSRFPNKPVKTRLVQQALREWFPEADILALATEEALEHTWPKVKPIGNVCFRKIPKGSSQNEFWKIYNAVTESLPYRARVILDFTHGLRSIPLITLLALVFLRAAGRIELEAVIYAAQEAKTPEGITPIFDLTPFLAMLDWAGATERFLEIGDTSKFHKLTIRENAPQSLVQGVKELEDLSYAVATNRTFLAGSHAFKALSIDHEIEKWGEESGPIKLLLNEIKEVLSHLAIRQDMKLEEQLQQLFMHVAWYLKHGYYEKAIGLAREWFITFVQYKCIQFADISEQHILPVNDEIRSRWDSTIGRIGSNLLQDKMRLQSQVRSVFGDNFELTEEWKALFAVWQRLKDIRNDLLHFGFRSHPKNPDEVRSEVESCLCDLKKAVEKMGLELPEIR